MAYTIKKTDGSILLTLSDSKVDKLSTSVTLIGKNFESYGEYYNNNLVGILENFASLDVPPRSPLYGQLWYNKSDGRMYVYGLDNVFKPVTGALVSTTKPTAFNSGDFWVDITNNQLWFSPDGIDFTLAGPQYSAVSGKSGWVVETVQDAAFNDQIVACLYNNGTLLGIASSADITFLNLFNGMKTVRPGFNLNTSISGIRFVGTATSADSVQGYSPNDYVKNNTTGTIVGALSILDNKGLYVGANQDISLFADSQNAYLSNDIRDKNFRLRGNNTAEGFYTALQLSSSNKRIGIFNENPSYSLDITGDTRIVGNLYIEGATTNVESVNLQINDKNIQLGYGQVSPDDIAVEGGGITLMGASDHNISWTGSYGKAWQVDDNFNLVSSTSTYKIGGVTVISSSTLGTSITSAPGVTHVGVLDYLTVTNVVISGSTISSTGTNKTLYLSATDSATIDVTNRRVSSVGTPTDSYDAATKKYVDDAVYLVGTKGFVFSLDVTNFIDKDLDVINYLNLLLPVTNSNPADAAFNLPNGVRARVLCSETISSISTQTLTLNVSTAQVDKNGSYSVQSVLTAVAGLLQGFAVQPTTTYTVREYRVFDGAWSFIGIIS